MAQHPQNASEIEHLIRLSAASRSRLSLEAAALRQRFDVPRRALHSLRSHPLAWLGGSVATGLAATFLFRRKPAPPPPAAKPRRGLHLVLGSLALTALRPTVKAWLIVQLKQFLAAHLQAHAASHPVSNNPGRAKLRGPI